MDGRKCDRIRKQLGLAKAELASSTKYRVKVSTGGIWDEPPRLVALAIVALWIPGSHGVLEEPSEPEAGMPECDKAGRTFVALKRSILKFLLKM